MTKAMEITTNTSNAITTIDSALTQRWIAFVDVRPKSKSTYDTAIKQLVKYFAENGITAPVRQDIINFRDDMSKTHKATTVALYLTATKLFFRWLATEGLYTNIADHIKNPRIDRNHKKDALSAIQAATLLKSVDTNTLGGLRDRAILALMLTAGLRTVEITRCNVGDLHEIAGLYYLQIQGKGRDEKSEMVMVSTQTFAAIKAYLDQRGTVDANAPLFASVANKNFGGRMTTRSISRIAKQQMRSVGIDSPRLTAHSCRHFCITEGLLQGATLENCAQLARHSSISVTMVYAHHVERLKNMTEQLVSDSIFRMI